MRISPYEVSVPESQYSLVRNPWKPFFFVTSAQGFSRGAGDVAGGNDSFFYTGFDDDATSASNYSVSNSNNGVNDDSPQYLELLSGISLAAGIHTISIVGREDGPIYHGFIVSYEALNVPSFDTALNVIPEPGTGILFGIGCLSLVVRRRKP